MTDGQRLCVGQGYRGYLGRAGGAGEMDVHLLSISAQPSRLNAPSKYSNQFQLHDPKLRGN